MAEAPMNIMEQIARLEQELQQKRAQIGEQYKAPATKELLREVVRERFQAAMPAGQVPSFAPPPKPAMLDNISQAKVEELVGVAFNQNLEEAIQQAIATHNPAIIDAFHDTIVDELYDEMLTQKMVPELPA
ncbi:MAG: hypothetical protein AAB864_00170 [Patescibacteria group bacterium]